MPARKILVVDDDEVLRQSLVEQLSLYEEFDIAQEGTGTKGVQIAKASQVDLVIMDVGLPDLDGREAVRMLRKSGFKAPIIMLTAHDTDSDTIAEEGRRQIDGVDTRRLDRLDGDLCADAAGVEARLGGRHRQPAERRLRLLQVLEIRFAQQRQRRQRCA